MSFIIVTPELCSFCSYYNHAQRCSTSLVFFEIFETCALLAQQVKYHDTIQYLSPDPHPPPLSIGEHSSQMLVLVDKGHSVFCCISRDVLNGPHKVVDFPTVFQLREQRTITIVADREVSKGRGECHNNFSMQCHDDGCNELLVS